MIAKVFLRLGIHVGHRLLRDGVAARGAHQAVRIVLVIDNTFTLVILCLVLNIAFDHLLCHVLPLVTEINLAVIYEDFSIDLFHCLLHKIDTILFVYPVTVAKIGFLLQILGHLTSQLLQHRMIIQTIVLDLVLCAL